MKEHIKRVEKKINEMRKGEEKASETGRKEKELEREEKENR